MLKLSLLLLVWVAVVLGPHATVGVIPPPRYKDLWSTGPVAESVYAPMGAFVENELFSEGEVEPVGFDDSYKYAMDAYGCSPRFGPVYSVDVPFATEALYIQVEQTDLPRSPWALYLRWDGPPSMDSHDKRIQSSGSSQYTTLTLGAPRIGRLFFAVTLVTNETTLECPGHSPAAHPPSGYVNLGVGVQIASCHYDASSTSYASYSPIASVHARAFGVSASCSRFQYFIKNGEELTRQADALYPPASHSETFVGAPPASITYFYAFVAQPHTSLVFDLRRNADPSIVWGTNAWVRHNAIAVRPSVFDPSDVYQVQDGRSGRYMPRLTSDPRVLIVHNPVPGFYSIGIMTTTPNVTLAYTAHSAPGVVDPGDSANSTVYIGYPHYDADVAATNGNVKVLSASNGLVNGLKAALDVTTARNGASIAHYALATFMVPPGVAHFQFEWEASVPMVPILSAAAPPVVYGPDILTDGSSGFALVAAPATAGLNTTHTIETAVWYLALVPPLQDGSFVPATFSANVTVSYSLICPQNCNGAGKCGSVEDGVGMCSCFSEYADSSGYRFSRTGYHPSCDRERCASHRSCTGCAADPACSWCLSTRSCIPGGGLSSTAVSLHETLCPAVLPNLADSVQARLVVQPEVIDIEGDGAYGVCEVPAVHSRPTVQLTTEPTGPPPPPAPGFASARSPKIGDWVQSSSYATECNGVFYAYGPVPHVDGAIFTGQVRPTSALCEFWAIDLASGTATDLSSVMGNGNTTGPGCRAFTALNCMPSSSSLVLYGGLLAPSGSVSGEYWRHTTDVWEYAIATGVWTKHFPNCYDPDYSLFSSTPHATPHVDAVCATAVLPGRTTVHANEQVGGLAHVGAVEATDPVFGARGLVVTSTVAYPYTWSIRTDSRPYFFNMSSSPPTWSALVHDDAIDGPICAARLLAASAMSRPSATFVQFGGYSTEHFDAPDIYDKLDDQLCVFEFFRDPARSGVAVKSKTLVYSEYLQHNIFASLTVLPSGLLMGAAGATVGTRIPAASLRPFSAWDSFDNPETAGTRLGSEFLLAPRSGVVWQLPPRPRALPLIASASSLVPLPSGGAALFGGVAYNGSEVFSLGFSVDPWVMGPQNSWSVVSRLGISPGSPSPRALAVAHYHDATHRVILAGGLAPRIQVFQKLHQYRGMTVDERNDLAQVYAFDTSSKAWSLLSAAAPPGGDGMPVGPSSCLSAAGVLYMYGGIVLTPDSERVVDTLLSFDTSTGLWSDHTAAMSGDLPGPFMAGGAVCSDDGSKMYVTTGITSRRNSGPFVNARFFELDLVSWVWTRLADPLHPFGIGDMMTWVPQDVVSATLQLNGPHILRVAPALIGDTTSAAITLYNPDGNTWSVLSREHIPAVFLGSLSSVRPDGSFVVAGGATFSDKGDAPFANLYQYNLYTRSGGIISAMPQVEEPTTVPLPPGSPLGGSQGSVMLVAGRTPELAASFETDRSVVPAVGLRETLVFEVASTVAYHPDSPTSGIFNHDTSVILTGAFPGPEFNVLQCGLGDTFGAPCSFEHPATLTCPLPKRQPSNATLALRVNGVQLIATDLVFEYLPCSPGTTGGTLSEPCTPCAIGFYSDTYGATTCTACPGPLYTPMTGAAACQACPDGHRLTSVLPDRTCTPCAAGSYLPVSNSTAAAASSPVTTCLECDERSYSDTEGATACTACPDNAKIGTTGGDSRLKCSCDAGYWGNATANDCRVCPAKGATCPFLENAVPIPNRGFWRDPDRPERVLECALAEACVGGAASSCASGYTGEACAECADQYYPLNGKCEPCPENSVLPLVIAGFVMLLFIILLYKFAGKGGSGSRSAFGSASIALNFIQMTALFTAYKMNWPDEMVTIMKWFSIMNLNLDVASPECAMPISYQTKWTFTMLIPVMVLVMYAGWLGGRLGWSWLLLHSCVGTTPVEDEDDDGTVAASRCGICVVVSGSDRGSMVSQMIHAYLLFLSLAYVFVSSKSLEVFSCSPQTDGTYFLNAYPPMLCYEGEWWGLVPYAILAGLVYGAGIPLAFWLILVKSFRPALMSSDDAAYEKHMARFGFLTSRYLLLWNWWELSIMGRKIAIIGCTLFFLDLTMMQNLMAMFVVFAAVLVQVYARPYRNPKDNKLEFVLLCTDYFILFLGILFSSDLDDTSSTVLTVLGVSVLILSILSIVGYMGLEIRRLYYTRRYRKTAEEHPDLVKRAEFVLTEDSYFALMEWVKGDEDDERLAVLTQVLEGLYETAREIRQEGQPEVFVAEVQKTFHVYRQQAADDDLDLLDQLVARIARKQSEEQARSLKNRLRRAATRVGPALLHPHDQRSLTASDTRTAPPVPHDDEESLALTSPSPTSSSLSGSGSSSDTAQ